MKIGEVFETRVEEKIDPVIKVAEVQDEAKLASEIGAYVVTPTIEGYLDDFLERYTDTIRQDTTDIGVWISGYFGSGKSHLAKILALIVENRTLLGIPAGRRFEGRVPPTAPRARSIARNLTRIPQSATRVLAFNLNTLVDSKTTPLPRLLLGQYFQAHGYSSNLVVARTIEETMGRRGALEAFHDSVARRVGQPWNAIRLNLNPFARHVYSAAAETAPDLWPTSEAVVEALRLADRGEVVNTQMLVRTMLDDLARQEAETRTPSRILLVLDESGQWIGDDSARLAQLQALVEEAAIKGLGRIWVLVTTHEDMGSIYQNARAVTADMKKIEDRFRFKWSLTTENIERVLEDRIFRKRIAGSDAVGAVYDSAPGVLRGLGELAKVEGRRLPSCERDRFVAFYPFFPYQIHLIPDVVKSLRAHGGRGEQLSGSTRTLLAITQDILRAGRRPYLTLDVGETVSFDEVYDNLAANGEVSADARRELSRIEDVVPQATPLTRRLAEVLFLVREVAYVPRTLDNVARLLAAHVSDDLTTLIGRLRPEIDRLVAAKLVARIGEEYEFLTGERRTFEDEVSTIAVQLRQPDRQAGLARRFVYDPENRRVHLRTLLGFETVPFKDVEFPVRIEMDGTPAFRNGDIQIRIVSPLAALSGTKLTDLEDQSLQQDEQKTIFVLCDRIPGFDQLLGRYLAMGEVVKSWTGDSRRSEEARALALERETGDLPKLEREIVETLKAALRNGHVVFRGASRALAPRPGQPPGDALRGALAEYWPTLYPRFERMPFRVVQEQKAIADVLAGEKNLSAEVRNLRLLDRAGALDPHAPLLDAIRILLASRQGRKERTLGADMLGEFGAPPYGWDRHAVRVGVAALVRAGVVKVLVGKKPLTNPADPALLKALRDSREFDRTELVLEDAEVPPEVLEAVRALLIKLTGSRRIDETPAVLHAAMETWGRELAVRAAAVSDWAQPAGFPCPPSFAEGREALDAVLALGNPVHRVWEIHARTQDLTVAAEIIGQLATFRAKWGAAFIGLRHFVLDLRGVEHLLPPQGAGTAFLREYEAAEQGARFAETEVWKTVQGAKAAADLESQTLAAGWRDEARTAVHGALQQLLADLAARDLPPDAAETLGAPLRSLLPLIDAETVLVRVAALPARARRLIEGLTTAVEDEVARRTPPPAPGAPPPRPVQRLRLAELAPHRRIRSEAEWDVVRARLDERVRALLKDSDLELS